jgi:ethanolamine utilization protein EutQ (cupin superfamily)
MAAFLSDEWFALVRERAESLSVVPGASLVMQHVVSGGPLGKTKVQAVVELQDGRVVEAALGKRADPACTLTWTYDDALAVLDGELPVDVAFMRGDLKVDGDYVTLMFRLRPMFTADNAEKVVEAIRAATDR